MWPWRQEDEENDVVEPYDEMKEVKPNRDDW